MIMFVKGEDERLSLFPEWIIILGIRWLIAHGVDVNFGFPFAVLVKEVRILKIFP